MRRFLYFITKPYSISVCQALQAEIQRSGKGESLAYIPPSLEKYGSQLGDYTTSIKEAIQFKPEIVFVPGNVVHDKIPGLKVQVFHGLCEEKGGHYKITGFFDLYCTSGPLITRKFQALAARHRYFIVVETGWPKVDLILESVKRNEIITRYGLKAEDKIILYAPTFSPKFKSSQKLLPRLKSLIKPNETWIIKFHDLMPLADKRQFLELNSEKIIIWDDPDNIPLLQVADLLISDTSSIVYEFILLDKPVITIDARIRLEKGINLNDIAQLREAIDRSLTQPDEFAGGRRAVLQEIQPYNDRQNAARVIAAAESVLASNAIRDLKKKPLNLYRKFQVRKNYH
jgi:CDP-glycerol glycerophosphotransferase (TagB/SpsB family)